MEAVGGDDLGLDRLDAELQQARRVELHGDLLGCELPARHQHGVDAPLPDVLAQPLDVIGGAIADRLAGLLQQVADVDLLRAGLQHGVPQTGHEQRWQRRGEERSRSEHDQVGQRDRIDRGRRCLCVRWADEEAPDAMTVLRHCRLTGDEAPVLHLGEQRGGMRRGRNHGPLHGQHVADLGDRGIERADDLGERRQKEVAEVVAGQLAAVEAVLEQAPHQRLVLGEGDEAVANIARGRHLEVAPQPAG